MVIDLDQVWKLLEPRPLSLRVEGVEHPVRSLRLADMERIERLDQHDDAANREFIVGLFEGEPPAIVKRLGEGDAEQRAETNLKVIVLLRTIVEGYLSEVAFPNRMARAVEAVRARVKAGSTSSLH